MYYAVFKLLTKPLKLLLSQLYKFYQNHINNTSLITIIALNELRCFGKHVTKSVALIYDIDGD